MLFSFGWNTTTEVVTMTNGNSHRKTEARHVKTINCESIEDQLGQVPDERLDQFLRFMARLIVRDLRDYPELPGDSGPTN